MLEVAPAAGGPGTTIAVSHHGLAPPTTLLDAATGCPFAVQTDVATALFTPPASWGPGRHLFELPDQSAWGSFVVRAPANRWIASSPAQPIASISGSFVPTRAAIFGADGAARPMVVLGSDDAGATIALEMVPLNAEDGPQATWAGALDSSDPLQAFNQYGVLGAGSSLLVAHSSSGDAEVLELNFNNGVMVQLDVPLDPAADVLVAGDLDGDGLAEVVGAPRQGSQPIQIARLDGGAYQAAIASLPLSAGLGITALGDADRDGLIDLLAVTADPSSPSVELIPGLPDGGFDAAIDIAHVAASSRPIVRLVESASGPIIAIKDGAKVKLLESTANRRFTSLQALDTGNGNELDDFAVGDLDGDGQLDVVVAQRKADLTSFAQLTPFFGSANQSFVQGESILVGQDVRGLEILDVNGDGAADLVAFSATDQRAAVLLGGTDPVITRLRPAYGGPSSGIFVEGPHVGAAIRAHLETQAGASSEVAPTPLGAGEAWLQLPDALAPVAPGSARFVLETADAGASLGPTFSLLGPPTTFNAPVPTVTASAAAFAHLAPGDPRALVLAVAGGAPPDGGALQPAALVIRPDPSTSAGAVTVPLPATVFGQVPVTPLYLVAADLNRDGLDDLLAVSAEGVASTVLTLADGGSHAESYNVSCGGTLTAATAADFNQDGLLDLAVGRAAGSPGNPQICFFLQESDLGFQSYGGYDTNPVLALATGDFNGDGRLDLASLESSNGSNVVFANLGDPNLDTMPGRAAGARVLINGASAGVSALAAGQFFGSTVDEVAVANATGVTAYQLLADGGSASMSCSVTGASALEAVRFSLDGGPTLDDGLGVVAQGSVEVVDLNSGTCPSTPLFSASGSVPSGLTLGPGRDPAQVDGVVWYSGQLAEYTGH